MGLFDSVFGSNKSNTTKGGINWKVLNSEEGINEIVQNSSQKTNIIFKHSTTCPISAMAKNRLERSWDIDEAEVEIYYLDLLSYRPVSNKIAEVFAVKHESPQVLVIKDGISVFDTSHNAISVEAIKSAL